MAFTVFELNKKGILQKEHNIASIEGKWGKIQLAEQLNIYSVRVKINVMTRFSVCLHFLC